MMSQRVAAQDWLVWWAHMGGRHTRDSLLSEINDVEDSLIIKTLE